MRVLPKLRSASSKSRPVVVALFLFVFGGTPLVGTSSETHHVLEHGSKHHETSGHAEIHDHLGVRGESAAPLDDQITAGLIHTLLHQAQGASIFVLSADSLPANAALRLRPETFQPSLLEVIPFSPPEIPFRPPIAC